MDSLCATPPSTPENLALVTNPTNKLGQQMEDLHKKLMVETNQQEKMLPKDFKNADFIESYHQEQDISARPFYKSQPELKENDQKEEIDCLAQKLSEEAFEKVTHNQFEGQENLSQHVWDFGEQKQQKPANIEDLIKTRSSSSDDGFVKIYQGKIYSKIAF